jgi:probable rRNA maturation factor
MEIDVLVDEGITIPFDADWLQGIAEQVLASENAGPNAELSLVITGQDRIRQLNRDYRGKDEPTDVLAFAATGEGGAELPLFVVPPDGVRHLGEVIISYPQAVVQAAEHQHPVEREVAILVIHGVLHLMGYEHDVPERERRMKGREAEILGLIKEGWHEAG